VSCKIDAVLAVSPLNWTRSQFLFMREQENGALDWTKQYDQFKAVQIGVIANWHRQGYLDYLASVFLDLRGVCCGLVMSLGAIVILQT